jgi:hypothetical protein
MRKNVVSGKRAFGSLLFISPDMGIHGDPYTVFGAEPRHGAIESALRSKTIDCSAICKTLNN